jgi:uncharacterized protein
MPGTFLTARWENLAIITYKIDPALLQPYIPPGLMLDTLNGDTFVSVVAFDFNDIKVKSLRIPFHVNFPEINLRFYVKDENRNGVVFISELVDKYFVPFVANSVYNENYKRIRMRRLMHLDGDSIIRLNYSMRMNGRGFHLNMKARQEPFIPGENTVEHFIKEHQWGFGKSRKGNLLSYEVEHPVWQIYPVTEAVHNFDFGLIYGRNWEILNDEKPFNIMFAKGSEVKVFSPQSA